MRELRDLQDLVQQAWRSRKPLVEAHVGDLAWWSREPTERMRAWREDGRVIAWGWLSPPAELSALVAEASAGVLADVLDWFEAEAAGSPLTVWSLEEDRRRIEELEGRGYRRSAGPFFVHLARRLVDIPVVQPPAGYRMRALRGVEDVPARVAVQRAAFVSTLTEAKYERLLGTWPYRPDLDVVAEATDGSFAAFCTAWLDDRNAVGELEPVGTHPAHVRRGLARASCSWALHALRERGAELAVVYARGDARYPAPRRLYRSLGFEPVGRSFAYVRDV